MHKLCFTGFVIKVYVVIYITTTKQEQHGINWSPQVLIYRSIMRFGITENCRDITIVGTRGNKG